MPSYKVTLHCTKSENCVVNVAGPNMSVNDAARRAADTMRRDGEYTKVQVGQVELLSEFVEPCPPEIDTPEKREKYLRDILRHAGQGEVDWIYGHGTNETKEASGFSGDLTGMPTTNKRKPS